MQTWLVAIVGGAIGSVVTALIAFSAPLVRARGEVASHDRFVVARDEDLTSWVSDRSIALGRELKAKTEELNKENLFGSVTHGKELALLDALERSRLSSPSRCPRLDSRRLSEGYLPAPSRACRQRGDERCRDQRSSLKLRST
jgi:hypothetical protein